MDFVLYRYQLLPISRLQDDLFQGIPPVDELIRKKNQYLGELLKNFPELTSSRHELVQKIVFASSEWLIVKLGSLHSLTRQRPDFKSESVEDWPNITVMICNDPNIQTIAVSKNRRAFSAASVVVELIKTKFSDSLRNFGLAIHVEPQLQKEAFWDIIDKHHGHIAAVRFE